MILAVDPRYDVSQLADSAGDRTFTGFGGTVLLSFLARDLRYCRADPQFPAGRAMTIKQIVLSPRARNDFR